MTTLIKLLTALFPLAFLCAGDVSATCIRTATGSVSYPLMAGQSLNAGTVKVSVEQGDKLLVTYSLAQGWAFNGGGDGIHLWIGTNLNGVPVGKNGAPIPGQFPYKSSDIGQSLSYQFTVPMNSLSTEQAIYIVAHASLKQPGTNAVQTGWAGNVQGQSNRWYNYFEIQLHDFCEPPHFPATDIQIKENPAITYVPSPS